MRNLPTRFRILGVVYAALLFAACIYVPIQVSYQLGPWQAFRQFRWLWAAHGFKYQGILLGARVDTTRLTFEIIALTAAAVFAGFVLSLLKPTRRKERTPQTIAEPPYQVRADYSSAIDRSAVEHLAPAGAVALHGIAVDEPIEAPPAENTPVPSFSGTAGNDRIPEAERATNPSPAAGSENAQAGGRPSVSPFSPLSELEFAPLEPEAPKGRKFNPRTVVVVVLAVLVVLWAIGSNYEKSVVNQTPTKPATDSNTIQSTWIDYTPADGSFNARFPATPELKSSTHNSGGMVWTDDSYMYHASGGFPMYIVAVYKYSVAGKLLTEAEAGGLFGSMKPEGWSSVSDSPLITNGGFFTKDVLFKGTGDNAGYYMIGRAFAKYSNKWYAAFLMSDTTTPSTRDTFFQSFQPK